MPCRLQVTGEPLPHVHHFGKPHPAPYLLTEQLLLRQAQRLGVEGAQAAAQAAAAAGEVVVAGGGSSSGDGGGEARHVARTPLPFSAIYAVVGCTCGSASCMLPATCLHGVLRVILGLPP